MTTNTHNAVQQLYVAYFNRPADFFGLEYWSRIVDAAHGDTGTVSAAFAASAEYKTSYAGLDSTHALERIYLNLFGHGADLPGLVYWTDLLKAKVLTIDQAVTAIAAGAQGSDLTTYSNRVTVADAFTAALDTDLEKLAYSGDSVMRSAKFFLSSIASDDSMAAALVPATLDASVDAVLHADWGPKFTTFTSQTAFANPTGKLGAALGSDITGYQAYLDVAAGKGIGVVSWFQYGGDTYIVEDASAATSYVAGTDIVVKLTGLVDLSNSTLVNGGHVLSFA